MRAVDLLAYPLVISKRAAIVPRGILTAPDQLIVKLCTPRRFGYAWDQDAAYLAEFGRRPRPAGPWVRWQLAPSCASGTVNHTSAPETGDRQLSALFTARTRIQAHAGGARSQVLIPRLNVERFRWDLPTEEELLPLRSDAFGGPTSAFVPGGQAAIQTASGLSR